MSLIDLVGLDDLEIVRTRMRRMQTQSREDTRISYDIRYKDDNGVYMVNECNFQADAWIRWGVGVHDAVHSAKVMSKCLALESPSSSAATKTSLVEDEIRALEHRVRCRHVHCSSYYWHFGQELENHAKMVEAATLLRFNQ